MSASAQFDAARKTPPAMTGGTIFLITIASFVVVVSGMKAAQSIIVPFLLAVFISVMCAPGMFWMRKKGVPSSVAVLIAFVVILGGGTFIVTLVGTSLNEFIQGLPSYQAKLTQQTRDLVAWLESRNIEVPPDIEKQYLNFGTFMQLIANTASGIKGAATNGFMILLTILFILLEGSGFPLKLRAALKDPEKSLTGFTAFQQSVNRYLAIKTMFSALTGITVYLWLIMLGIDYPRLWGLIAFLLNYIPNIGSIIAAIPAVMLALVQHGIGTALMTALGYILVNTAYGSILEPRFMGAGLGLSTLVVFLSLVFWGWVLGPVGMFLSVPLTMILKIALESNEDTRWLGIMLGKNPPERLEPQPAGNDEA